MAKKQTVKTRVAHGIMAHAHVANTGQHGTKPPANAPAPAQPKPHVPTAPATANGNATQIILTVHAHAIMAKNWIQKQAHAYGILTILLE